jgi:hypothetical protein
MLAHLEKIHIKEPTMTVAEQYYWDGARHGVEIGEARGEARGVEIGKAQGVEIGKADGEIHGELFGRVYSRYELSETLRSGVFPKV